MNEGKARLGARSSAMTSTTRLASIIVVVILVLGCAQAEPLSPEEASKHVDENGTVCGLVASAHFADGSKGQPTFLNLGKAYPNQVFTAVIWGSDRSKFGSLERSLDGKQVCVTGRIQLYRGKPEIVVRDKNQLSEE
jgi:DNA/RNA endonuclease YhcR with UshA esterase domain